MNFPNRDKKYYVELKRTSGDKEPYKLWCGRGKTGWDAFKDLVIPATIPLAVGISVSFLNAETKKNEDIRAKDAKDQESRLAQEVKKQEVLSQYFDQVSLLLTTKEIKRVDPSSKPLSASEFAVRAVPRARTLAALSQLDGGRKGRVINFLYEAALIKYEPNKLPPVDLDHADLKDANLRYAKLAKVDLRGVDLIKADLRDANLTGANLTWVDLTGANLAGANLAGANLTGANLTGANLTGAKLTGAKLTEIAKNGKVWDATFSSDILKNAHLCETIMPTSQKDNPTPKCDDEDREILKFLGKPIPSTN
jgi:uncharacterized protein YjbI with pentapeptide repeats